MNTQFEETVSAAFDGELDGAELDRELDGLTRFEACEAMRRQAALRALLHGRQPSRSLRESLRDQIAAEPALQANEPATVVSLMDRVRAWMREPHIPQTVPSWAFAASVAALAVVATAGGFGGGQGAAPVPDSARAIPTATGSGGEVRPAASVTAPHAVAVSAAAGTDQAIAGPDAETSAGEQSLEQWDQYLSQHRRALGAVTEKAEVPSRAPGTPGFEGPL